MAKIQRSEEMGVIGQRPKEVGTRRETGTQKEDGVYRQRMGDKTTGTQREERESVERNRDSVRKNPETNGASLQRDLETGWVKGRAGEREKVTAQ